MYPRYLRIAHRDRNFMPLVDPRTSTRPEPRNYVVHEELVFDGARYDVFMRTIRRQEAEIYREAPERPQFLLIGLRDYRNLLVLSQTSEVEKFEGMTVIVMPEEDFAPQVLRSRSETLSKTFWDKRKEEKKRE